MPPALRIGPGEKRALALKALVPGKVPDNSRVAFSVDDPASIELLTEDVTLEARRANKDGVVIAHAHIEGRGDDLVPGQERGGGRIPREPADILLLAQEQALRRPIGHHQKAPGKAEEGPLGPRDPLRRRRVLRGLRRLAYSSIF